MSTKNLLYSIKSRTLECISTNPGTIEYAHYKQHTSRNFSPSHNWAFCPYARRHCSFASYRRPGLSRESVSMTSRLVGGSSRQRESSDLPGTRANAVSEIVMRNTDDSKFGSGKKVQIVWWNRLTMAGDLQPVFKTYPSLFLRCHLLSSSAPASFIKLLFCELTTRYLRKELLQVIPAARRPFEGRWFSRAERRHDIEAVGTFSAIVVHPQAVNTHGGCLNVDAMCMVEV